MGTQGRRGELGQARGARACAGTQGRPHTRRREGLALVRSRVVVVRVLFMCGPAGSGKSTVARQFEALGMIRLSFDQEAWDRGFRVMPLPEQARAAIDADLRERLVGLVRQDRSVVLDFSFWSRDMRDDWRRMLAPLGVIPETLYLATDRATCLARVRARALGHADDFTLDPDVAAEYFDHFEVPSAEEGPLTVIGAGGHGTRERCPA